MLKMQTFYLVITQLISFLCVFFTALRQAACVTIPVAASNSGKSDTLKNTTCFTTNNPNAEINQVKLSLNQNYWGCKFLQSTQWFKV